MPTTTIAQPSLATLMAQLEEIWRHIDTLLDPLTPADWQRQHGKDWIFADLPYQLGYYDRDTVANPILKGTNLPADEQKLMRTMGELDAWNARKFANAVLARALVSRLCKCVPVAMQCARPSPG
jgi:hypothetical protein